MKRSFVSLAVLVSLAISALPASAARKTPLQGTDPARLIALAEQSGTIGVIVSVAVEGGWNAAETRHPEKGEKQRAKAREAKDRILRKYPEAVRIASRDFGFIPAYLLVVDAKTLRKLMNDDDVESIEENSEGGRTLAQSTVKIGSAAANQLGYTGLGQTVVVLDDGVQRDHPMLRSNMYDTKQACFSGAEFADPVTDVSSRSLCPNGKASQPNSLRTEVNVARPCNGCSHGTQVAGVIGGQWVNNNMYGVASEVDLLPIQVYSKNTSTCSTASCTRVRKADVVAALEYVHTWAPHDDFAAVNMSLDFNDYNYTTRAQCNSNNNALRNAIATAYADGIAVVVAAGNQGTSNVSSPSCIDNTYSVGATTDYDAIAVYSNTPAHLSFFAPGGDWSTVTQSVPVGTGITTSTLGSGTIETAGTSMAAPHVAGAFALLRQRQPNASINKLYNDLRNTGTLILMPSGIFVPRINVDAALNEP